MCCLLSGALLGAAVVIGGGPHRNSALLAILAPLRVDVRQLAVVARAWRHRRDRLHQQAASSGSLAAQLKSLHPDHDPAVSLLYIWLHARMLQTHEHANEAHYAYLHVLNPEDAQVAVKWRGAGLLERQQACGLVQRQHLPSQLLQQGAQLRVGPTSGDNARVAAVYTTMRDRTSPDAVDNVAVDPTSSMSRPPVCEPAPGMSRGFGRACARFARTVSAAAGRKRSGHCAAALHRLKECSRRHCARRLRRPDRHQQQPGLAPVRAHRGRTRR